MSERRPNRMQLGRRRSTGFLTSGAPPVSERSAQVARASTQALSRASSHVEPRETDSSELKCSVGCRPRFNLDENRLEAPWREFCDRATGNFHFALLLFADSVLCVILPFIQMIMPGGFVSPGLNSYFAFYVFSILLWSIETAAWAMGKRFYVFTIWPWVDTLCLGSLFIEIPEILSEALALSAVSTSSVRVSGNMYLPWDYQYTLMLLNILRIIRVLKVLKHGRTIRKCVEAATAKLNAQMPLRPEDRKDSLLGDIGAFSGPSARTNRSNARSLVVSQRISSRTYAAVVASVLLLVCILPVLYVIPDDAAASVALQIDTVQIQMREYEESCSASTKSALDYSVLDLLNVGSLPSTITNSVYFGYLWPASSVSAPGVLTSTSYLMCGSQYVVDQANIDAYKTWASQRALQQYSQLSPGVLSDAAYTRINTAADWVVGSSCSLQLLTSSASGSFAAVAPSTSYLVSLRTAGPSSNSLCDSNALSIGRVRYLFPSISAYNITNESIPFVLVDYSEYEKLVGALTLGLCLIVFFGILLAHHALFSDALKLILEPLSRLVQKVNLIRRDPLSCANIADDEYRMELSMRTSLAQFAKFPLWKRAWLTLSGKAPHIPRDCSEVSTMERSMVKIGTLLAVGYGKTGGRLIAEHVSASSNSGLGFDIKVFGRKVDAVYMFCTILDFSVVSEVLQDRVMIFANQVAEIVHGIADEFLGAPAANQGNTLMIVWPTKSTSSAGGRTGEDENSNTSNASSSSSTRPKGDLAVLCAAKIIAAIARSPVLAQYSEHPGILSRIQNYKVRLAFGIHAGWSVEGALGSQHKVDAAYLGPHVTRAQLISDLAFTKYRADVLVSDSLLSVCSRSTRHKFRRVDCCRLDSQESRSSSLFVLDLDIGAIQGTRSSLGRGVKPTNREDLVLPVDNGPGRPDDQPGNIGHPLGSLGEAQTARINQPNSAGSNQPNSAGNSQPNSTGFNQLPSLMKKPPSVSIEMSVVKRLASVGKSVKSRRAGHRKSEASILVSSLKGAALVKLKVKQDRARRQADKASANFSADRFWCEDDDLRVMRARFESTTGQTFRSLFDKGIANYLSGEWAVAKEALAKSRSFWRKKSKQVQLNLGANPASGPDSPSSRIGAGDGSKTGADSLRMSRTASRESITPSVQSDEDERASISERGSVSERGSTGERGSVGDQILIKPFSAGDDGPSVACLEFMASNKSTAEEFARRSIRVVQTVDAE